MRRSTWKQHVASEAQLTSMLDHARENWPNGRAPCQQEPLLAIGVLTLPVLVRTPELRRYHRAVHYTQAPVAQGRVCLRYLVSGVEMYNLTHKAASAVREENGTSMARRAPLLSASLVSSWVGASLLSSTSPHPRKRDGG